MEITNSRKLINEGLKFFAEQQRQHQEALAKFVAQQEQQLQSLENYLLSSQAHPQVNSADLVLGLSLEPSMKLLRKALRK